MNPSSPSSASQSLGIDLFAPGGEAASHNNEANARQKPLSNPSNVKSPRSVRFLAPAKGSEEEKDNRYSSAISLSGSFVAPDHEGGDMLAHFKSPQQRHEELPPFCLTREDVEAAFEFLDVNGSGVLTMSNLKQRLSAFYPQLTTKEYKFLVEDPSGSNGLGGGGGGGGSSNQAGNAESSNAAQSFASPFSADKPKADSAHSHSTGANALPTKAVTSESFAANNTNNNGGAGAHAETPPSPGDLAVGHGTPGSRAYGSRAGLDVDQLWNLIQSFQQLQQSFGAISGGPTDTVHRQLSSSGTRRHGSLGGGNLPYDASATASLLHGSGGTYSSDNGFDAVGEAFRVYDPRNTHYVEKQVLSRIMAQIGFGELSEEDMTLLVGTADFDGDGRISLDDFRRLVNMKGRFKKA